MRVFMFQNLWAPNVADGTKPHTIRLNARCKPGDLLSLRRWTGKPYRSKQQLLRTAVCTAVSPISITGHGVCVDGLPVPADQIARADGFRDWLHMLGWFADTHGLPFTGELIEWDPSAKVGAE